MSLIDRSSIAYKSKTVRRTRPMTVLAAVCANCWARAADTSTANRIIDAVAAEQAGHDAR
jgi:hypothetical protein